MGLKMLILDEADHLLDLGFRKTLRKLWTVCLDKGSPYSFLPQYRKRLSFSAILFLNLERLLSSAMQYCAEAMFPASNRVRRMSQLVLKREHEYVDTVGFSLETPAKVKQSFLITPHEQHLQIVYHLLKEHNSKTVDYKVIVFCTTAMMTSVMFSLFQEMKMNVKEIHSRKPQIYRNRISEEFKESKRLILVSSDVSSCGMNYPDVTLVIHVDIAMIYFYTNI